MTPAFTRNHDRKRLTRPLRWLRPRGSRRPLSQHRLLRFLPARQRATINAKAKTTEKDMERIDAMRKITIGFAALTLVLVLGCEQAVRKVAESPSDSKKYADAYKKAS